jgi:hypothetical protein
MARFPKSEAEIATLGQDLVNGLRTHTDDFPNPPVRPDDLQATLQAYLDAREAAGNATGAATEAIAVKQEALEDLTDQMKSNLRYAENTVKYDNAKLAKLRWGGRGSRTPLEAPGQVLSLTAPKEGIGWILLEWKEPVDGGRPGAYRLQRRLHEEHEWEEAGMSVDTQTLLRGQKRGVEWYYRVIAVNKAGEGEPSNSIKAVL